MVEAEWIGELNLKNLPESSMRFTLHELESKLSTGTTIRLLRCRDHTTPKDDPEDLKVGRTRNELVASFYDEKKA